MKNGSGLSLQLNYLCSELSLSSALREPRTHKWCCCWSGCGVEEFNLSGLKQRATLFENLGWLHSLAQCLCNVLFWILCKLKVFCEGSNVQTKQCYSWNHYFCFSVSFLSDKYSSVFDMLTSRLHGESISHRHRFTRCPPDALFWVILNDLIFMACWFENCLKPNAWDWTHTYTFIHNCWLVVYATISANHFGFASCHNATIRRNTDDFGN